MWKRIVWDILALCLVCIAPWWLTLIFGVIGTMLFPWYLEIIFLGVLYDALFGSRSILWYKHLVHTGIFMVPLFVAEFVRTKINL